MFTVGVGTTGERVRAHDRAVRAHGEEERAHPTGETGGRGGESMSGDIVL